MSCCVIYSEIDTCITVVKLLVKCTGRWKSGSVKASYKNSYMHANVGMDIFESCVSAATVLRFVLFVFVELVQFWPHTGIFIWIYL